jgi:formylglycine-generating enzyme required for sulfatase activity/class 3 adenylate cyclase
MSSSETAPHDGGSPRRLAAILSADIKDSSRLMGLDEEGTLARMKRYRREIIEPTLAEHHGRIIKNTGDGFLAIFDSPLEAVRCAIVIQQSLLGHNAAWPKQQWLQYRIGVNLGDVIIDPDEIYGDGVNIAARVQALARPGTVYISGGVYEQVKNKLVCGYQSLGDEKLRNITEPVRIYRVLPDPDAVAQAKRRKQIRAGIAAIVLVTGGLGGWYAMRPSSLMLAEVLRALPASPQPRPEQQATVSPPAAPRSVEDPARPLPQPSPPPMAPPGATSPQGGGAPVATSPQAGAPTEAAQVAIIRPPRVPPQATGPYEVLQDCEQCPQMVTLPGGTLTMGSNDDPTEKPVHHVSVSSFAIGRLPVTIGEWRRCVAAKACAYDPSGDEDLPVHNVSWNDAQQFVSWLSHVTKKIYRLPTEAEWEYAARAGASTKYWWGNQLIPGMANCNGCSDASDQRQPMKVASFTPNPFGLYDMTGGVAQWVSDCWHKDYQGAPKNGSSWEAPNCRERVLRGGSWRSDASYVRAASRNRYDPGVRYVAHGVRVVRSRSD